jgi:hypothetical protein
MRYRQLTDPQLRLDTGMNMKRFNFLLLTFLLTACAGVYQRVTATHYRVEENAVHYLRWQPVSGQYAINPVIGADPETFEQLRPGYGRDQQAVYRGNQVVENADPGSFTFLNEFYAVDINHAYFDGHILIDSDVNTFEYLGDSWAKDKSDYYYTAGKLDVCDKASFKIIKPFRGRDSDCYFFMGEKVPIRDIASLVVLSSSYAKDQHYVYWGRFIVEGADPKSFVVKDTSSLSIAKDKDFCYAAARKLNCAELNKQGQRFCGC